MPESDEDTHRKAPKDRKTSLAALYSQKYRHRLATAVLITNPTIDLQHECDLPQSTHPHLP